MLISSILSRDWRCCSHMEATIDESESSFEESVKIKVESAVGGEWLELTRELVVEEPGPPYTSDHKILGMPSVIESVVEAGWEESP